MPYKPMHPCSYPGCPNLTYGRYCDVHKQEENKRYETYDRDGITKKYYGHAWEKVRKRYVKTHPICEMCFKEGIISPVEHVHHIVPLKEGGTNDESNLMSLCKSCHSKIHAERGDRWRKNRVYTY